jgi:hypothetical protein
VEFEGDVCSTWIASSPRRFDAAVRAAASVLQAPATMAPGSS